MERTINEIVPKEQSSQEPVVEDEVEIQNVAEKESEEESEEPHEPCLNKGTYVLINHRDFDEDSYRYSFSTRMARTYSGKVLVVDSTFYEGPSEDEISDDNHSYRLCDIYGQDTGYCWASSMFATIPSDDAPNCIIDGLSKGIIAFNRVLRNYLISPLKVGIKTRDDFYSIVLNDDGLGIYWGVAKTNDRTIFSFPDEGSAAKFIANNIDDFSKMIELF